MDGSLQAAIVAPFEGQLFSYEQQRLIRSGIVQGQPRELGQLGPLLLVAIYTLAQMYQTYLIRDNNVVSQRAWVNPTELNFDSDQGEPLYGQQVKFGIQYNNTGNSPALNFGDNAVIAYTDIKVFTPVNPDGDLTSPAEMPNRGPDNPACTKIHQVLGGITIFPSDSGEAHHTRPFATTAKLSDSKEIMIIYGCAAYSSFNEIRTTAFCYYVDSSAGGSFKSWPIRRCPNGGNYAN